MCAPFVRDGDILPRLEFFVGEKVSRLVVVVAGDVVVECPVAAGTVNEMAEIIRLSGPKPRDPAGFAMLLPYLWIEPALGIQRSDENISYSGIAKGMFGLPCQFEPDLTKARWQA